MYIGKVNIGSTDYLIGSTLYGTCDTAAATAAKVVTMSDFDTLLTGVTIHVKFTNSNTVANPTLNVNNTGAKSIKRYGTTAPSTSERTSWIAGSVISFTYDGTYWQINDYMWDTTYSAGTKELYDTGTDTANRVWSAAVLRSIGDEYLSLTWLGEIIPKNSNIDSYTTPGIYGGGIDSSVTSTLTGDIPISGAGFLLIVKQGYLNNRKHLFLSSTSGKGLWWRCTDDDGTNWSNWERLDKNVSVASTVPNITYGSTMTIGSIGGVDFKIALPSKEGASDFTDGTEILSSYASNNGFSDTNAPGAIHRRKASSMYNYIKTKLAVTNESATIGTNNTTIATIAGVDITAKIGSYKPTQTAVTDPSYSGLSSTFISGITLNANGVISPTKKKVVLPYGISYDGGKGFTNPYHLVGEANLTYDYANGNAANITAMFLVADFHLESTGILIVLARIDGYGTSINTTSTYAKWILRSPSLVPENVILTTKITSSSSTLKTLTCRLYHEITNSWKHARFTLLDDASWAYKQDLWTLYSTSSNTAGNTIFKNIPSDETLFVSTDVTTSKYSTNIEGGALGSIPYQTAAGTTAFLSGSSSNGYILAYNTSTKAPYWKLDSNSGGTVTKVSTGVGLTGGDITTTGTIKAALVNETKNSASSSKSTSSNGGLYAVELDKDGKLAVRVPWINTNNYGVDISSISDTTSWYYIPISDSNGTNKGLYSNDGFKVTTTNNSNVTLLLGGSSKRGVLRLYSEIGTSYANLLYLDNDSETICIHTLPNIDGTILNTGTTSFTQSLSSGTKIGTIKINNNSTDLYCNSYTGYNIVFKNNANTTVDTYKALTSPNKTLKAGTNVEMSASGNVITISATDTKYSNFVESGASAAAGLVPKPSTTAGTTKFLCEDGTWKLPSYTTNTDTKVTQTVTTSSDTDYRPLLLGYNSTSSALPTFSTVTNTAYAASNVFIQPSTGYLFARRFGVKTDIDFTQSNNGVSSTQYPGYFIYDKNGKLTGRLFTSVQTDGKLITYVYTNNYKTDGSSAGEMCLGMSIDKSGNKLWLVTNADLFRNAIYGDEAGPALIKIASGATSNTTATALAPRYAKIAYYTATSTTDHTATLLLSVSSPYYKRDGILSVSYRKDRSSNSISTTNSSIRWISRSLNIPKDHFLLVYKITDLTSEATNKYKSEVYVYVKLTSTWENYRFSVLNEGAFGQRLDLWTVYDTIGSNTEANLPSGFSLITSIDDSYYCELGSLTDWASVSDVTVSSVLYHTFWKVAPTSSNQVYGWAIHPTSGLLYYIYNNKGTYSATAYSANTNTLIRVYRQNTSTYDTDFPILVSRTASIGTAGTNDSYTGVYGVMGDTKHPTINPIKGIMNIKGINVGNINICTSRNGSGTTGYTEEINVYDGDLYLLCTSDGDVYLTDNGSVGIGTYEPKAKLDVRGTTEFYPLGDVGGGIQMSISTAVDGPAIVFDGTCLPGTIGQGGDYLTIGCSTTAQSYIVYAKTRNLYVHPRDLSSPGYFNASGVWVGPSDLSLKSDISAPDINRMHSIWKWIEEGGFKQFKWKATNKEDFGVIAQEVLNILPEVVDYDESKSLYGVDYSKLHTYTIASIAQELKDTKEEIKQLQALIAELKLLLK